MENWNEVINSIVKQTPPDWILTRIEAKLEDTNKQVVRFQWATLVCLLLLILSNTLIKKQDLNESQSPFESNSIHLYSSES